MLNYYTAYRNQGEPNSDIDSEK